MNFDKMYTKLTSAGQRKMKGVFSKIVLSKGIYREGLPVSICCGRKELFKARIVRLDFLIGVEKITEKLAWLDSDCTAEKLRSFLLGMYGIDKIRDHGLLVVVMKNLDYYEK